MKYRRFLILFLAFALLLGGCHLIDQSEPSLDMTPDVPVTESVEEPWIPYDGTLNNYVYYYPNQESRERKWEEDILYMAGLLLEGHPSLTPEESHIRYREGNVYDGYYSDEHYDPELRRTFLEEINGLIPEIWCLKDDPLVYELQRIIALLHDAHASVYLPESDVFPVNIGTLYEGEDVNYFVYGIPKQHESLLYARLLTINDIPIEEILQRYLAYSSYETEICARVEFANAGYYSSLMMEDMLCALDIIEEGDHTATFGFRMADGSTRSVVFPSVSWRDFNNSNLSQNYSDSSYRFEYVGGQNYWYRLEGDLLYFRISAFEDDGINTFRELGNQILGDTSKAEGVSKIVVDLRDNPGGYNFTGYDQLVSVIQRVNADTVYVLINNGSFSRAISTAAWMRQALDNAILVGEPGGQPANFFGDVEEYEMPNSGTAFRFGKVWLENWEGNTDEALMPDVFLPQTLQDAIDGKDTVMEYILSQ